MSYISYDKLQLINLEYSLSKELLRSNRSGAFSSTTIIGCNTRKYHGLLITPQAAVDNHTHVLLSTIDETIIQREAEFNLGIHKYPGAKYEPKGHKYIREQAADPIPKLTYRVGGVVLTKETLLTHDSHCTLLRYTLCETQSPTRIRFKPFLAFRNIHTLSKANLYVNKSYEVVPNGVSFKMYNGYTPLLIQFTKEAEYTHVPDWYYNIEYIEELKRGYEGHEDLYVPGFFELDIKKGESIIIAVGTEEVSPKSLVRRFNKELKARVPRNSMENCLINSAQQFVKKKGKHVELIAGFPWHDRRGRDAFLALPGITLSQNNPKLFKQVTDSLITELKSGLFPNVGYGTQAVYNSPDPSLWFFWAMQEYASHTKSKGLIWRSYKKVMQEILNAFRNSVNPAIKMTDNCLLYVKEPGKALTWMDAYADSKPVTPRYGYTVECNALWYNAVCFALELAELANDKIFIDEWSGIKSMIKKSFNELFVIEGKKALVDFADGAIKDQRIRPNQIIAVSLPFSPLSIEKQRDVVEIVRKELLTPYGLRTLSPQDMSYKGTYEGDTTRRELAAYQGTAYPWLLGAYAQALFNVYGEDVVNDVEEIINAFDHTMREHGVGTISELFDGDPPHKANGAISFAASVGEILRIMKLIENIKEKNKGL